VYTAGGTTNASYRNDYVELFNPGSVAGSLNGYSLIYTNPSGTVTTVALSAGPSVAAGGYYLVQFGTSNSNVGAALPATADKSGTNLVGTGGRLDLQQNGILTDRVGYGSAVLYEGSAAPVSSATLAIFRAFGGCTDSNNNAADFATGPAAPRTPDSAGNPCNGPAPTITGFAPASGPAGASVTLSGTGFTSSAAVAFNGTAATVAFVDAATLTATVPGGASSGPITVTTATGTATSTTSFTVTVPVLTASPTALTGLAATPGAPSPAQRYQLSGSSLDGTAVLVQPSAASLEVSLDGLTYGPTARLPLNGSATLAATSVYVRVASGGTVGAITGSVANTNGTTTATVAVGGAVVPPLVARRWTGAAGTAFWFDAANWEGSALPGAGDDVVLDHRYVAGAYTVVLGPGAGAASSVTVASLRLRPAGGDAIEFTIPGTNNLPATATDGAALTLTRSLAADTALSVGSRGLVINASGALAVSGAPNIIEVAGASPTVFLLNGGGYRHQTSRSVESLVENLSATPGTEGGNFYYRVPQASYTTITAGRTYGNLVFQRGSTNAGPSSYTTSGSAPLTINGSLTIESNVVFAASLLGNIILRGNLMNTGNFRFAPNNTGSIARLVLQGTTPQTIAGTALADPGAGTDSSLSAAVQLEINNSAGATLRTPVTLSNTLVLTSGLLTTDVANPLTLKASAVVQGGSDASFVSGPVLRPVAPVASATAFLFPVGKGGAYRPLTLTVNNQSNTVVYRAEQVEGNASRSFASPDPSGTDLARVSRARYFTLTPFSTDAVPVVTQPTGFSGTVSLSYGADDGVTTPAAATLVVAKRADATQPWANAGRGGYVGTPSTGTGTLTSGNIVSFSDFTLGSTDPAAATNPLPVHLTALAAVRQPGGAVALAWATASEHNSSHFEVQRSPDGQAFTTVARLAAAGSSVVARAYAATDANASLATTYYRLRQVDLDGTPHYSSVATVSSAGPELTLSPNPAHDYLHLTAALPTAYTVRSLLGQALVSGTTASGPARVPVAQLPAGVYFLELRTAAGRAVQRFVKE